MNSTDNKYCPCGSGKSYTECCGGDEIQNTEAAPAPDIPQLMHNAIQQFQAGKYQMARQICAQVLQYTPGDVNALHLSGVIAQQTNNHEDAARLINKAIESRPDIPDFHNSLGNSLAYLGKFTAAVNAYNRALTITPGDPLIHFNAGRALANAGDLNSAITHFKNALANKPDYADACFNLANIFTNTGEIDKAIKYYEKAIALDYNLAEAHNNLGVILNKGGNTEVALEHFNTAIKIRPNYIEAINNLANILQQKGNYSDAENYLRKAIGLRNDNAELHNNLGNVLKEQGRVEDAILHFRKAIELQDNFAEAYNNLGNALQSKGELDEAISSYKKTLELRPDLVDAHSNLLYIINYDNKFSPDMIYEEYLRYSRVHEAPLQAAIRPHTNDRSPDRPLRIGYVSPDFRAHSVAYYIEPVLAHHDHDRYEVFCYYNHANEDDTTRRLQALADHWRSIVGRSDDEVARLVRDDRIDILVDLAGHTSNNRLLVFARKPAPVQASWIGYPNTTGLQAMDYRITDRWANPPGQTDKYHTEKLIYLPGTHGCYQPPPDAPPAGPLPALASGQVTFASLNNLAKVTPEVIRLWSRLLLAIPQARLLMAARGLDQVKSQFLERFAEHGVPANRLELLGALPFDQYLALHQRIDVNLDTFPYTGGITTCHSLWMGVPVITLAGSNSNSRIGACILNGLELGDMVADSEDAYVNTGVQLASRIEHLATLRSELRTRMKNSPLTNAPLFTQNLEKAYQYMWENWCKNS